LAELVLAARPTWHRSNTPESYLDLVDRTLEADLPRTVRARLHLAAVDSGVWNRPAGVPRPTDWERVLDLVGGDESLATEARLLQAAEYRSARRFDDASKILDGLDDALEPQPVGIPHVRVAIERAKIGVFCRELQAARAHGLRGLTLCDRIGHLALEGQLWQILATVAGYLDNPVEQARISRKSLLRARQVGERRMERRALFGLAMAETEIGALDQAAQHTADSVALCVAAHDAGLAHHSLMLLVEIDFARGELDRVRDHLKQVREHYPALEPAYVDRFAMWSALASWARWGSAEMALEELRSACGGKARAAEPLGYFDEGKLLAARSYVEPEATIELAAAFDRLEERARADGKLEWLRPIAIDRAHLNVAAAALGQAQGKDVGPLLAQVAELLRMDQARPWEPGSFAAACGRVLLSGVMTELVVGQIARDEPVTPGA
jgi:hypothetical protein